MVTKSYKDKNKQNQKPFCTARAASGLGTRDSANLATALGKKVEIPEDAVKFVNVFLPLGLVFRCCEAAGQICAIGIALDPFEPWLTGKGRKLVPYPADFPLVIFASR